MAIVPQLRNGSHWTGPLLGSDQAMGGVFENVPSGFVDRVRSRYKCYLETFDYPIASAATLAGSGATATDINTPTAPTYAVTGADPFLLVNPGTAVDAGVEIQWVAAVSAATYITPAQRVIPPIVSTATLMDNRELIWASRVGIRSNSTLWDGKALFGIFTQDTTLLSFSTGIPSVATGGGIGFHISELGLIRAYGCQTAITTFPQAATTPAGTTSIMSVVTMEAADTFQWYDFAFRARFGDASTGVGLIKFYINGTYVAQATTDLPFQSTQTYATTVAILNGPVQLQDLAVDYIFTAITSPGRTNTSA